MTVNIVAIPADNRGNLLFLKDFRKDEQGKMYIKYRSTYNDMPFTETEIWLVDNNQNFAIMGDGRFSAGWISKLCPEGV